MPKWLDLNEVDDDEILLKKNRMSRSLVLDTPEVADAAEEDFLDTMEPAKKSMTIFFMIDVSGSMKGTKIGSLNSTIPVLILLNLYRFRGHPLYIRRKLHNRNFHIRRSFSNTNQ